MSSSGPSNDEATAVIGAHASADASLPGAAGSLAQPLTDTGVGRYLVIDELGRGAMGFVLRAYDPKLQREVALKRLRVGVLGDEGRVRLVREARAMARLSHPNVVAVYDVEFDERVGVVLVMEYVRGTTLRQWLDREPRPSWREIVDAFIAAGRGLVAAHDQGLLHRDFKLENVLVGTDGRVRVTDFGLARVTAERWPAEASDGPRDRNDRSGEHVADPQLTEAGTVMGTPAYMAPEQHEGRELDARADQYALCVGLWRALSQRWPFEGRGHELAAAKRAGAPRWPADVAMPRHVVDALLRGLATEPDGRWPTTTALLAALGHDPSRRRRAALGFGGVALAVAGVFAWRALDHRRAVAACATDGAQIDGVWNDARADAIASAFAATGIGYAPDTWQRARSRLDDHGAQWQHTRVAICEAEIAGTLAPELAVASRGCLDEDRDRLDALLDALARPDPTVVQRAGTATTWLPDLRECSDEALLRARPAPPTDPALRTHAIALRSRLDRAAVARVTGQYAASLAQARAVRDEAAVASWAPMVAEAKLAEGRALDALGRASEARTILEEAFFDAGAAARDDLALEIASLLVFAVGERLGQHDDALHWGRLAQMLARRLGRSEDLASAGLLDSLGNVHDAQGAYAEALELHRRALTIQERLLGPDHPQVAVSLNSLGTVHHRQGRHAEALQLYARALTIREQVFGPEHPHVAGSLNNVANAHRDLGHYDEALALQRRGLDIVENSLGPEHPRVAVLLNNLGELHRVQGDHDRAIEYYARALSLMGTSLGAEHRDLAVPLFNLGLVHAARGEHGQALAMHRRALAIREQALGPDHPDVAASLLGIGELHRVGGDAVTALVDLERALAIRERSSPASADLAQTRFAVARALWSAGAADPRAIELAAAAGALYATLGAEGVAPRVEVLAWLATRVREPGPTATAR